MDDPMGGLYETHDFDPETRTFTPKSRKMKGERKMEKKINWMKEAGLNDPPWAPIGRGGALVQMPKPKVVYDRLTLISVFCMGLIIGCMVTLMVMGR